MEARQGGRSIDVVLIARDFTPCFHGRLFLFFFRTRIARCMLLQRITQKRAFGDPGTPPRKGAFSESPEKINAGQNGRFRRGLFPFGRRFPALFRRFTDTFCRKTPLPTTQMNFGHGIYPPGFQGTGIRPSGIRLFGWIKQKEERGCEGSR